MPKDRLRKAEEFSEDVAGRMGDNLRSLILYGDAARGAATGPAGANLLMIVADASPGALREIESAVAAWARRGEPAPLIFTEAEWQASTDVFPMEMEDMRDAHRLLRGRDPFEGLTTTRANLRHELERELRGKLLHLRAEYAAAAVSGRALTALLLGTADTFFILFRTLVRLHGGSPPGDLRALVQQVAEIVSFDPEGLNWLVASRRGDKVRALKPDDPIAVSYLVAVEQLAQHVDSQ